MQRNHSKLNADMFFILQIVHKKSSQDFIQGMHILTQKAFCLTAVS